MPYCQRCGQSRNFCECKESEKREKVIVHDCVWCHGTGTLDDYVLPGSSEACSIGKPGGYIRTVICYHCQGIGHSKSLE